MNSNALKEMAALAEALELAIKSDAIWVEGELKVGVMDVNDAMLWMVADTGYLDIYPATLADESPEQSTAPRD